jgi:hypothetical protein
VKQPVNGLANFALEISSNTVDVSSGVHETQSLLYRLRNERSITDRNGELHARKAEHTQQDLTF